MAGDDEGFATVLDTGELRLTPLQLRHQLLVIPFNLTHKRGILASHSRSRRGAHLAKRLSDLKQNGTQEKTPFSDRVFHILSLGVLRFVASVSFKNH